MRSRGFTLIELLVVIAIIGLLASIILASLNSARAKGRDARRVADLHSIQTALELYYSDHNGYPSSSGNWWNSTSGTSWITGLVPTYIAAVPQDPVNVGSPEQYYYYNSDGTSYCIQISQESSSAQTNPMYWGVWSGTYKLRTGQGTPTALTWCQTH